MRKAEIAVQANYFNQVHYRDPFHPVVGAYAAPKIDFIKSHVPLEGRILDVGSGNGIFAARFAQSGAAVVGVDSSYPLLRQNPHRRLICGDATTLPFPDASFDLVFEANVLHHVPDRELVVREMTRVSRGHVVLIEPNLYNPLMLVFFLLIRAERGGLKSRVGRLRSELQHAGLRVIASLTTGMISQNNTPERLLCWLRRFDRPIWWGEYIVMIAQKDRS